MKTLFDPENRLMQVMTRLTDLLIISILWSICSIPLVTVGASTTALYYVTLKMVEEADSSILRSFFRSFWRNLRQGVVLTVLLAGVCVFLYWDQSILTRLIPDGAGVIQLIFRVLGIVFVLGAGFVFPLLARFENTIFGTLRNAWLLALANLPRAVLLGGMNLVPLLVYLFAPNTFFRILPVWLIFAPGVIAYFGALLLRKPLGIPNNTPEEVD